jgi:N-acetylmuramoyl-L-alanine amidase CwlA
LRFISVNAPAARKNHYSFGQINLHHTGAQLCSASSAEFHNMSSSTKRIIRQAFAEFSQTIGKEIIEIRLYKEQVGYLCERELIESDGSTFTQVLPFTTTNEVREFLHCDPHFSTIKTCANTLLGKLALEVPHDRPSPNT